MGAIFVLTIACLQKKIHVCLKVLKKCGVPYTNFTVPLKNQIKIAKISKGIVICNFLLEGLVSFENFKYRIPDNSIKNCGVENKPYINRILVWATFKERIVIYGAFSLITLGQHIKK